jgi:hypothetical protein
MTDTKPVNPYFNSWLPIKETKVKNPDEIIIPSLVLVSFFEDYEVDELVIRPDEKNDGINIVMLKDGKRLPKIKI